MNDFFKKKRFLAMLALLIGMSALAIDAMLPAFPDITTQFDLQSHQENEIQKVIFAFMLGISITQFFFGIISDIFGRKSVLLLGLVIYILASVWAVYAHNFGALLIARFLQGAGLGAPRVLTLTIVRDVTSGREMARIMSFVMMIFMIVPILAPMIGQLMLFIFNWQSIFILLALFGIISLLWTTLDLPETFPKEQRQPLALTSIIKAIKTCLSDLRTVAYLLILSFLFSLLMIYIGQFEQIFQRDVYAVGEWFVLIFAMIASAMIASAVVNSYFVMRRGLQSMIKFSLAIMCIADSILLILTLIYDGIPPMIATIILFMLHFFSYSIMMTNFNSLIMLPYKNIAGTASALISSLMTIIGVAVAHFVSSQYNATLYILAISFFAVSISAFIISSIIFHHPNTIKA